MGSFGCCVRATRHQRTELENQRCLIDLHGSGFAVIAATFFEAEQAHGEALCQTLPEVALPLLDLAVSQWHSCLRVACDFFHGGMHEATRGQSRCKPRNKDLIFTDLFFLF